MMAIISYDRELYRNYLKKIAYTRILEEELQKLDPKVNFRLLNTKAEDLYREILKKEKIEND
jgi:hypothetical protein